MTDIAAEDADYAEDTDFFLRVFRVIRILRSNSPQSY